MEKDPQQKTEAPEPEALNQQAAQSEKTQGEAIEKLNPPGRTEMEAPEAAAEPSREELAAMLDENRARAEDDRAQLMRARADIENLRRRQQKELENAHKFAWSVSWRPCCRSRTASN